MSVPLEQNQLNLRRILPLFGDTENKSGNRRNILTRILAHQQGHLNLISVVDGAPHLPYVAAFVPLVRRRSLGSSGGTSLRRVSVRPVSGQSTYCPGDMNEEGSFSLSKGISAGRVPSQFGQNLAGVRRLSKQDNLALSVAVHILDARIGRETSEFQIADVQHGASFSERVERDLSCAQRPGSAAAQKPLKGTKLFLDGVLRRYHFRLARDVDGLTKVERLAVRWDRHRGYHAFRALPGKFWMVPVHSSVYVAKNEKNRRRGKEAVAIT
ncbi:hypothetical protein DFH09DRAFT_1078138 [Mycena vulgaris]|nr:hypothetical protein DFH09DRAFT_1078138 [Mycena vulgaris]